MALSLPTLRFWSGPAPRLEIADAAPSDIRACAEIHAQSFSAAWQDGELAALAASRGAQLLVAQVGKTNTKSISGFVLFKEAAKEAEVLTIATAPGARRHGVAMALMEAMIRRCLSDRLEEIFLEVDERNHAALALYRKLGFQQVGERSGYYEHRRTSGEAQTLEQADRSKAFIMRLDLTQ